MGKQSICDQGFVLAGCRCPNTHYPLLVRACPPGHAHLGEPVNAFDQPIHDLSTSRFCHRCYGVAPAHSFRGSVCGFCADMLERQFRPTPSELQAMPKLGVGSSDVHPEQGGVTDEG